MAFAIGASASAAMDHCESVTIFSDLNYFSTDKVYCLVGNKNLLSALVGWKKKHANIGTLKHLHDKCNRLTLLFQARSRLLDMAIQRNSEHVCLQLVPALATLTCFGCEKPNLLKDSPARLDDE